MKIGIAKKLVVLFICLVVVFGVVLAFYFLRQQKETLLLQFDERGKILLNSLALSSEYPLLVGDNELLGKVAAGIVGQKDVIYCEIRNEEGDILFRKGTKEKEDIREYTSPVFTGEITEATGEGLILGPEQKEARRIGELYLVFSLSSVMDRISQGKNTTVWFIISGIAVASVLTGALCKFTLGRPVKELTRGIERLAGGDFNYKVPVKSKDEIGVLAASFNKMADDLQRTTTSIVNLNKEITERKWAEEALAEERNLLRTLIDAVPDHIHVKDTESRFVLVNNALARRAGATSPEELIGKTDFDFFPQEVSAQYRACEEELMQLGQPVVNREESGIDLAGKRRWVLTTKVPLRDSEGDIIGLVGINRDITELKQAEQALRESEKAERTFGRRLAALQEVSNELSQLPSVDELCRRAVELGRTRLGFDRLSVWLVGDDPSILLGTFGVDEHGHLRDERSCRFTADPGSPWWRIRTGEISCSYQEDAPLRNDSEKVVGRGSYAAAALWDGENVVGYMSSDNLLLRQPITERRRELLALYASALGHLCTRKRAEQALRNSEALYHSLVESLPLNVFRKDLEGRVTFGNKLYCETMARPLEKIIGKNDFDFFPKELAEKYRGDDKRVVETGEVFEDVEEHQKPDGERIYVQVLKTPVRNFEGEIIGTQGIFWDVTDRKRAEEALIQERYLMDSLMDNLPDAIYFKDTRSRFTKINRAQARRFGLSDPSEALGKTDFDFFTEEHARPAFEDEQEVMKSGRPLVGKEEKETWPDGRATWVSTTKMPLRDEKGNIIGTFGVSRDITERKRAEEALARERYLMESLMENVPDSIYFKDAESRFTRINKALTRRFGLSDPTEALGKTDFDFFTEEHARPAFEDEQEVMKSGRPLVAKEEKETWSDGKVRWVSTTKMPLRDEKGKIVGTFGVSRDITDRKRAEQELKRTAEELARSNAELEQFAYVASHDLQEPLRMVGSYAQLLAKRYKGKLDKDADDFIYYVVDGATRMRNLINDLLAYSRVGTRGKPFEPTNCDAMLQRSLANLQVAVEDSGAVVTHDPLPTVTADPTQLEQLFQNLLGNAIKFHGDEPPHIHVAARRRGKEWTFFVRDNGIGIDAEYAERIFVVFQRLHRREEYSGTGIGLAICKKIVDRHGGRIWLESKPGKGSTFYFTIPKTGDA